MLRFLQSGTAASGHPLFLEGSCLQVLSGGHDTIGADCISKDSMPRP